MKRIVPAVVQSLQIFIVLALGVVSFQAQSYLDAAKTAEIEQGRIERAKALIAAHQLDTAASELESVRAATKDYALRNVSSVMLMNVYLEAGNYTRAEALLEESFRANSGRDEDSLRTYFALAGQAVNGARSHLARYRSFGINIADAALQSEAVADLDRLRAFIERMISHAKEIASERKAYDSLSLLEDVLGVRLTLAKDTEEQAKWSSDYASAREMLASSQTQVASLAATPVLPAFKTTASPPPPAGDSSQVTGKNSAATIPTSPQAAENKVAGSGAPAVATTAADPIKPIEKGSLNSKAAKRVLPHYPPIARQMGMTGMVRVYVVLDENGKVVEISRSEGPALLRAAAEAAARQWIFESSVSDGRPVRVSGYLDFNFTL